MSFCSFPECNRELESHQLCATHATQFRKGRILTPIRKIRRPEEQIEINKIENFATINLTKGFKAKIDIEDIKHVNSLLWHAGAPYARASLNKKLISLHEYLWKKWGYPDSKYLDHKNGDPFDCRKMNLRIATGIQNCQNRKISKRNTSGFKGVTFKRKVGKWFSSITVNKNRIHLGVFDSPEEAARAYAEASIKYHGEYSRTNELINKQNGN